MSSIAPCIWFDGNAEEAASFYADMFPDSRVDAVRRAPADFHSGKAGDVVVVEFTVLGLPFVGRNGGEDYRLGDGMAFLIRTRSQEETDRYWNAIVGKGGQEGERGRCKDRFGLWWQIVPGRLSELLADADRDSASRVFAAMMSMRKFDIAVLERAADAGGTEPGVRAGPG
jgi:predicted 3-demethylubiquinone-9 3-methyltransferase (glyoxalase superfamily)